MRLPGQTSRSASTALSASRPHYVYRCFDKDDDVIYIGCTSEVARRISAHRRGNKAASRWLKLFMVRHEVEGPFPDRDTALAVEAAAILREQPPFNIRSTGRGMWAYSSVAEYLIERGHIDLAVETACKCWRETKAHNKCDPWCLPHVTEGVLPVSPVDEVLEDIA